jgi:hypothetical protein
MKLSYDVFIRHEVYRALQGASAHDQERVSDFIESLAGNPFREGDATIPDEHGRTVDVTGTIQRTASGRHARASGATTSRITRPAASL